MERILEERVEELSSTKVKQVIIILLYRYSLPLAIFMSFYNNIANCYNDQETFELVDCVGQYFWSSNWSCSRDSSCTGCQVHRKLEQVTYRMNSPYLLCFECLCLIFLCSLVVCLSFFLCDFLV